jgi:PAS domain S-box-containing protein
MDAILDPPQERNKSVSFSKLLFWLLPSWLVLAAIMCVHYFVSIESQQEFALHNERVIVELMEELLGESLSSMSSDAKTLSYMTGTFLSSNSQFNKSHLINYFAELSNNKPNYDQIRYINAAGDEVVRINNSNGEIQVVDKAQLQNKSRRYYFQRSNLLPAGDVYISPLDLNVEGGSIEEPFNPTIRVAAPVFDSFGQRVGVIVLNYRASVIINKMLTVSPSFMEHLYLISPEGDAIIQPSSQTDGPFIFNTDNSLDNIANGLVEEIQQQKSGQLLFEQDFYTFSMIETKATSGWTIISVFPKQRLNLARSSFSDQYLSLYLFAALCLSLVVALLSYHTHQNYLLNRKQRYEKQFRRTLENIQLAAITVKADGSISFCNHFFLQMTGYEKTEVIGKPWVEMFIPPTLQSEATTSLANALKHGHDSAHAEEVVQHKNGEVQLVSWTSTFSKNESGEAKSVTFIGENVTEKKATQDHLQQLSHTVEQSQNSVMISNLAGKIVYVNPAFCTLTQYTKEEVIGQTPQFLQSGEMEQNSYKTLWHTIANGRAWHGEFHNRKKNGDLFWERASISPVKDVSGELLYFVAVKQDITEEKRLAAQVESERNEKIQHEKLAAVGNVVNMIAHDLRNPLSSVKMALQIYSRKEKDELFDISLEQVKYMEDILEELMAYSRPDQSKPEWTDLNKLIQLVINSQQRLAAEKQVLLNFSFIANLPTLYADPVKLRQALQNVVVNAIQAASLSMESNPQVDVSSNMLITESGSRFSIEIKNNGQSVDPCLADKVFEPFFTTRAKGTGLGLAIVKRIIENHHGNIRLSPRTEMSGTIATIELPLNALVDSARDVVNG